MASFVILMAVFNVIGGRWSDIIGPDSATGGRLIFRCILPGVIAGFLTPSYDGLTTGIYVWFAVTAGSALWFPWGWSFDEITGRYDATKYHWPVHRLGISIFPLDGAASTNRRRGILMKGLRGLYDVLTFALLTAVNPWAMLYWPVTGCMGLVFHSMIYIVPEKHSVLAAEFCWGLVRGALIFQVITS